MFSCLILCLQGHWTIFCYNCIHFIRSDSPCWAFDDPLHSLHGAFCFSEESSIPFRFQLFTTDFCDRFPVPSYSLTRTLLLQFFESCGSRKPNLKLLLFLSSSREMSCFCMLHRKINVSNTFWVPVIDEPYFKIFRQIIVTNRGKTLSGISNFLNTILWAFPLFSCTLRDKCSSKWTFVCALYRFHTEKSSELFHTDCTNIDHRNGNSWNSWLRRRYTGCKNILRIHVQIKCSRNGGYFFEHLLQNPCFGAPVIQSASSAGR